MARDVPPTPPNPGFRRYASSWIVRLGLGFSSFGFSRSSFSIGPSGTISIVTGAISWAVLMTVGSMSSVNRFGRIWRIGSMAKMAAVKAIASAPLLAIDPLYVFR